MIFDNVISNRPSRSLQASLDRMFRSRREESDVVHCRYAERVVSGVAEILLSLSRWTTVMDIPEFIAFAG
jgi:hypothetical protein